MRWGLFFLLAAAAVAFSAWVYLRVDLQVRGSRWLAAVRAAVLVTVLLLLFDARLPLGADARSARWVLLDASLSMDVGDGAAWRDAVARASELEGDGWTVATFGADPPTGAWGEGSSPIEPASRLAPALDRAAESGGRQAIVLSDMRLDDRVAAEDALARLPLEVSFETFGGTAANAGISSLEVPDFTLPDDTVLARVEYHAAGVGDSITLVVSADGEEVSRLTVAAPDPGLRATATLGLGAPPVEDRARVEVRVEAVGDVFPTDDVRVDHPAVGRAEGAVVVVSLTPDWEPRYLVPVLAEVTGLPTTSYLRTGDDRFVVGGRANQRGAVVDSASVTRAVVDAALVVVHGLSGSTDAFGRSLVSRAAGQLILPTDPAGAALAGVDAVDVLAGEWYASADVPSSPIAGSLAGLTLQGLPPLGDVLILDGAASATPLVLQLRGAGVPEPAILLVEEEAGRTAVATASGFWRWAVRDVGREPYRRLWSGVAGWLLEGQRPGSAVVRPRDRVIERGDPVLWALPADPTQVRLELRGPDGTAALDTLLAPGATDAAMAVPPGPYGYTATNAVGDTLGVGRFDVLDSTDELLPVPEVPQAADGSGGSAAVDAAPGRPLRSTPWPYLLVIGLLCGEWVVRRRSGLR